MILDFDPSKNIGLQHRNLMTLEYSKLVLLCTSKRPGMHNQTINMGEVVCDKTAPEKRISSNFFTVPLKKASGSAAPLDYPRRKHGPLFKMGKLTPNVTWGIRAHEDWVSSLSSMLAERRTTTPFFDLALFVFRNNSFYEPSPTLADTLCALIGDHYPVDFAEYWQKRIRQETRLRKDSGDFYQASYSNTFSSPEWLARDASSVQRDEQTVSSRVTYLEDLLRKHNIPFN